MGRLIDAEKITEVDCRGLEGYVKPEHYEIVASFFFEKFINCQPTAYDVDKVVEEIREQFGCKDCEYVDEFQHPACNECAEFEVINDICEIVRKGGVNE